jgi:DNA-binding LytR/AlgR family response regulator
MMAKKIKCLVVDDEQFARKGIKEYIDDIDFLEFIGEAENPVEALSILKDEEIDLLLLDINMPKISGIEFLKNFTNLPATIITTAYQEYAIESYELNVLDYLLKPISFERFLKSVSKAQDFILTKNNLTNNDYFFVKSNGIYEQVIIKDINAIESLQNYVVIHTNKNKLVAYLTLKLVEEKLSKKDFIKIHKSYIVSKNAIQSISLDTITINELHFPIGNTYKSVVFEEFLHSKLLKR